MESFLITIAPVVAILIAWPVIHFISCKTSKQTKAADVAFTTLAVIWVAYYVTVVIFEFRQALLWFAISALFVPLNIYFAFMIESKEEKAKEAARELTQPAKPATPAPIFASKPAPQHTPSPSLPAVFEPIAAKPEPTPTPVFTPAPAVFEPVPVPAPVVAAAPATLNFVTCYAKAKAFGKKGLWAVAAGLFEESARLTTDASLENKALFAAMSSYLKANDTAAAKRVALTLKKAA